MKILWLASWYPNSRTELNGDFIQRQANSCPQDEVEIVVLHVCSIQALNEYRLNVETHVDKNPIKEIIVYYPETILKPLKLVKFIKAHKWGIDYLNELGWKPDLIHLHVIYPAFLAYLFYFKNIPFVISEHYGAYRLKNVFKNRAFFKWISKLAVKKAKTTITLNSSMSEAMRNHGMLGTYCCLPNVVDTNTFFPIPRNTLKFRWLHVSNMEDSVKNVMGILRTICKIQSYRQDFEFLFVGDGIDKDKMLTYCKQNRLEKIVSFKPNIAHEDVAKEMQNANAFVLFSNYEGLPCVLLEAMATGLPVIATDTGDIAEWIKPEYGKIIPKQDESALELAMNTIMDNYGNYNFYEIAQSIESRCSYTSIGNALIQMYKSTTPIASTTF